MRDFTLGTAYRPKFTTLPWNNLLYQLAKITIYCINIVRFEIVVCLTGASKNMGTTTQSRTSYLSKEIIWGYRFKNVVQ